MKKHEAIKTFGFKSGADLGRALGLSRQRISQIPDDEDLDQAMIDRIVGAALRLGKPIPDALMKMRQEAA
jgi:hypothetical protein